MNILLLGNGFDLYHNLPTKYINFLNTVIFLKNNSLVNIKTIGDIFCCEKLNSRDKEIYKSYNEYKEIYDGVEIDLNDLNELIKLAENNMWFSYLSSSLEKDMTWIDFEKEISAVIKSFEELLSEKSTTVIFEKRFKNNESKLICRKFDFYLSEEYQQGVSYKIWHIKDEYTLEYPLGTENKIIDKEKIISTLYKELVDLAKGLKIYLKSFVESILDILKTEKRFIWQDVFSNVNCAITFNYTNTYEKIYNNNRILHLHGDVDEKIVLGINPDGFDKFGSIDTTFLSFKKYFQRVTYKTDTAYLSLLKSIRESNDYVTLFVIGHSLDITDSDIIEELFSISSEIYVLNYSDMDEAKHVSNLVNIYGKSGFDELRVEKNLTFISINADITKKINNSSDIWFPDTLDSFSNSI